MQNSRFDYVAYDLDAQAKQNQAKAAVQAVEAAINALPNGRYKSLALTALEESYCWIGKAVREDQIARNGSAPLQEPRSNS